MKGNHKVEWCDRGIFPIYYGFCPSEKAWKRQMKILDIKNSPYPDVDGRCTTFDKTNNGLVSKRISIVTINERCDKNHLGVVGLIIHEATHVWQQVRDHMGEESPSVEFEAHSMEYIAGNLYGAWVNTRAPKKIKRLL